MAKKIKVKCVALILSTTSLVIFFLIKKHYIELADTMDSWLIWKGLIFYKDFDSFHLPLGKIILQPLHILSNWDFRLDPLLGLALGIATLATIYLIGNYKKRLISTSVSLLFFSIFYWYTGTGIEYFHEQLTGLLLAVSILFLLKYFESKNSPKSNTASFILGILIGLTLLAGQVVSLTLGAIVVLFMLYSPSAKTKDKFKNLFLLFLGAAIPFLITSIYFVQKNAFQDFFYKNFTYYLFRYLKYGRSPISSLPEFLMPFYLPLLILIIEITNNVIRKQKLIKFDIMFLILCLSTIPFGIFSVFHPHHLTYALPVLALSAGYIFANLWKRGHVQKVFIVIASLTFLLTTLLWVIPWYFFNLKVATDWTIANANTPPNTNGTYETVAWIQKNTLPTTRILVIGNPFFYILSDRLPSIVSGSNMEYVWQNNIDNIKKQVSQSQPEYWILSDSYIRRLIKNYDFHAEMDFINEELKSHYTLKEQFIEWQIWQRDKSR